MNMIGHDYESVKVEPLSISVQTCLENDCSCGFRQHPAAVSVESDEERFVVTLIMRQPAAVLVFPEHQE